MVTRSDESLSGIRSSPNGFSRANGGPVDYRNPDDWWKYPIEFYGKVVDERGTAVPSASIEYVVSDESEEGTTKYHAISDPSGLFTIQNLKGMGMTIVVSKDGYYETKSARRNFEYAGGDHPHVPNPKAPVLFQLHKKAIGVELVRSQKVIKIPRDGTPVEIDLMTGKKASPGRGTLVVQCWTQDQDQPINGERFYDWKCRISVPGGGLIERREEFDFIAPVEGYLSFDEVDMPRAIGKEKWSERSARAYFLKLKDGNYARISLEIVAAGDHFVRFESYLNPDKSRNLEFDPSKQIQVHER